MQSNQLVEENLIDNLKEKSIESFLLAIEIYNKPTIKYRLEGFLFFICNAWELMLKSYMIKEKGKTSIYFKNKPYRTIFLRDCIRKTFTNDKDPIRKNLEIINELRNISTHFIIKELEIILLPFLQACVINYSQKLYDFCGEDISNRISSSFMSLVINSESFTDDEILSKYGDEIYNNYKKMQRSAYKILSTEASNKLAININLNVKIVKNKNDAKINFRIVQDGEEPALILKEIGDINSLYPYSQKGLRELVEQNLQKKGLTYKLNQNHFSLICKKYNLKNNEEYFYHHKISNRFTCSQKTLEFVTELIHKNPNIIEEIKIENKKNN